MKNQPATSGSEVVFTANREGHTPRSIAEEGSGTLFLSKTVGGASNTIVTVLLRSSELFSSVRKIARTHTGEQLRRYLIAGERNRHSMANELMHELQARSIGVLSEPEIFTRMFSTKQTLIRSVNRFYADLVGFRRKDLAEVQKHDAFGTFLGLMMGDIAIDRTETELNEISEPEEWLDIRILDAIAPGKGVALRDGVELYRKGSTPEELKKALRGYWEAQRCWYDYSADSTAGPRPIRIKAFSDESFERYGRSLALDDSSVSLAVATAERFYTGRVAVVSNGEPWELGRLVADTRSHGTYSAVQCDSHKLTEEILVPDCDCLLTVAQYREPESDSDGNLYLDYFKGDVFLIRRGQPVLINKGVAHTAPTRLGYSGALTTPVLFRKGTTEGSKMERDIEVVYFREQRVYLSL